jgi:hypothetical protein
VTEYTAHLADDERPHSTACGESWQSWQAPKDLDLVDPQAEVLPPVEGPGPHVRIRFCGACRKVTRCSTPSS